MLTDTHNATAGYSTTGGREQGRSGGNYDVMSRGHPSLMTVSVETLAQATRYGRRIFTEFGRLDIVMQVHIRVHVVCCCLHIYLFFLFVYLYVCLLVVCLLVCLFTCCLFTCLFIYALYSLVL